MSSGGARRHSGGGHSSLDEEQLHRQAGTSSSYLFQGTGRSSFPEEDTVEGRGRRRQSRSKSPGRYYRPHHSGSRDEQSSRPNRSRSRSYDQNASSSRNPHNYYSNRRHDEQLSGSSRSSSSHRSYGRHANRYVDPKHDSSGGGGLVHRHSQGEQRYRPQVSPYGPSALHNAQGHGRCSTSYASPEATSTSIVSSSQFKVAASAPTCRNFHPLELLRRDGVRTDLVASLRVGNDCRLLGLMMSIGNPSMINAALNGVSQDISAGTLRKNSNIPGLIVARLRAFEKHGLPQIPPGVDQNLMASLGIVDEDYCLRRLMMRIGDASIINAALRDLSQQVSRGTRSLRKSGIPGLLAAQLRDLEKNGLPQIPPGVDQNLMASLGVDDDCCLLKYMTEIGDPEIINAALRDLNRQVSRGRLPKGSNIPGLITAQLRDLEKNGFPQIPPGVDQNLMASLGVDDDCSLLDFMTTIGDSSVINRALHDLDEQMNSGRRVKNVGGLLCSKLRHYERLARADPGPTAELSASPSASPSEIPSDLPSSSPSAKSSVNSSIDAEGETTAPLINAAHGNATPAESFEGTSDSSFKRERMGSATSSAEQTVLMPVNDGSATSKAASSYTHKHLPTQSKSSAVTVTSDNVVKAEKILKHLARDGRDVATDGKYIGVLFASDPDAVMTALTILLKASGGDENKINALLSVVRLFIRTAVKKSDERAKLHIDAFEASEDVRNCMESICRDNPSLAPSFQSFGDKLKGVKGVSAVFVDKKYKPIFTEILQKEEERRAVKRRRAEEVEHLRLEAEYQAAETKRQRLEVERREKEASKRRQVEADKRKELEENARPLMEIVNAQSDKETLNINSGLGANLQQRGLLRGLLKASSASNGSRGTGSSISNKQKQVTANTLQQQMAKNVAARLQLERKQNAENAKVEAEKNIASVISSLESMVDVDDDKLAERSKSSLGDLKDLTASGQINAVHVQDGAKLIDVFKSVYSRLKKINKRHPVFREAAELKQNWTDILDIALLEEKSAKLEDLQKAEEPTKLEEELPAVLDCLEKITDKSSGAVSPARLRSLALIDHLDKIQQKLSSSQSNLVGRVAKLRKKWSAGSSGPKRSSIPKRRKPSGAKLDVNESKKKKKKAEKQAPKKRKKNKNNSYEQELKAEAEYLNEDNGERSRRAGFGSIAPVQDPKNVTDEPNLAVPDAHRQNVGEEKAKLIDVIVDYVREHPDFLNDKGRGKSIYLGNNVFLSLSLLGTDTLRHLMGLIEKNFSTMEIEEKLDEATKSCEFYYDTKSQNFYNSSGEVICTMDEENDDNNEEILELLSRAGAYYVFAFNKNGELYGHSGGKYMSLARFFDYAYINTSQINRLLDENGKPPARIVFCSMAQLPFAGDLDLNDEVPNTRNRIVEVVESVLLKILKPTIPGRQLYGDGRTMSAKEFVAQMVRRHGSGQGLGFFHGIEKKKSKSKSKSTGDTGMGAPGMARASQKTGATACFRDLVDPKKLASFEFHYIKGRGSEQETIGPIEGPLRWEQGYLKTTLNGDDAIEFNGKDNGSKGNQAHAYVATHLPITYLPSDGSEAVELGTVLGGGLEELFPKPTTWVCISGVPQNIGRMDVKDQLKEALQDDEDESIVRVELNTGGGTFNVQFAKVWEARGCATLLDENKSLFGSKITVELLYER